MARLGYLVVGPFDFSGWVSEQIRCSAPVDLLLLHLQIGFAHRLRSGESRKVNGGVA